MRSEDSQKRIERIADAMDSFVKSIQRDLDIQFDKGTGRTVVRVLSRETGEVIREIPAQGTPGTGVPNGGNGRRAPEQERLTSGVSVSASVSIMTLNVLIVDDDKRMRSVLRSLLAEEGHDVTSCADGLEADRQVQRDRL